MNISQHITTETCTSLLSSGWSLSLHGCVLSHNRTLSFIRGPCRGAIHFLNKDNPSVEMDFFLYDIKQKPLSAPCGMSSPALTHSSSSILSTILTSQEPSACHMVIFSLHMGWEKDNTTSAILSDATLVFSFLPLACLL